MADFDRSDMNSYLRGIAERIASLEVKSEELQEKINGQIRDIESSGEEFREELEDLRREMNRVREDARELSDNLKAVIQEFKMVTREGAFDRLKRKVDDWNLEKLATHKDFRRMVEDIKN